MAFEDSRPRRWQAVLAVTMTVIALELVSVSVSLKSWDTQNWARNATRWSIGMPMPALDWVQAEVEWKDFDFGEDLPHKNYYSEISKWTSGLHVTLPHVIVDALVALLLYVGLRRLVRGDERYLVRSIAIGAGGGVVIEGLLSPTVLTFQAKIAWLSLLACVVLVPLAMSLWSRGASRPWRAPLIMSFVAAWIAFPVVRFGDLLLTQRIKNDRWSTLENLVVFVVLSLFWLLVSSIFTWWFRRRKRARR